MKFSQAIPIFMISCAVIFLFADAGKISPKKISYQNWLLNINLDSAKFYATDTLTFFTEKIQQPPYKLIQFVDSGYVEPLSIQDTNRFHPQLQLGNEDKHEFSIGFGYYETRISSCCLAGNFKAYNMGLFSIEKKTNTLVLDFGNPQYQNGDDLVGWKIDYTMKYHIQEFSKGKLVLVKMKNN